MSRKTTEAEAQSLTEVPNVQAMAPSEPAPAPPVADRLAANQAMAQQFMARGEAPVVDDADEALEVIDANRRALAEAMEEAYVRLGQDQQQQREEYQRYLASRKKRPFRATQRTYKPDVTLIVDSQGNPVAEPGYEYRWVRMIDSRERPSPQRAATLRREGFEPVIDPHTGQPITDQFGMAMKIRVEDKAARTVEYQRDLVDAVPKLEAQYEESLEAVNRELGYTAVRSYKPPVG